MRNKFFLSIVSIYLFTFSCSQPSPQKIISSTEMETIIQEFTEFRINQYLYSNEDPKDNLAILMMVLNKHNLNYNAFSETLKSNNPKLYKKLISRGS